MMSTTRLQIERLLPWIERRFSRSPGPGGQNVNKLNTRITLFFDLDACSVFTPTQKSDIRRKLLTRMTRDGRLWIVRHKFRTQRRNRTAAEMELIDLLEAALRRPTVRKATRPSLRSRQRRLDQKRKQGLLKKQRRSLADD